MWTLLQIDAQNLYEFTKWLASIIVSGDVDNAWLALLPADIQSAAYAVGQWLAQALGFGT